MLHGMTEPAPQKSDAGPSTDTRALIARHRAGDPRALQDLFVRFYERVRRIVQVRMSRFLLAREEVDDVVQDVFIRVLDGVERFEERDDARFIDLIARMIQNELANHDRRERAQKRGGDLARLVRLCSDSGFDVPADSTGVVSRAERREQIERLDSCLSQLSDAHREVVLWRQYAGADWKTVAEAMERPSPEACQELYRRARIELARRMASGAGDTVGELSG